MEELRQENYELKQKLNLAVSTEAYYVDEIEHLKAAIKASESAEKCRVSPGSDRYEDLFRLEDRALTAERRLVEVSSELELERQQHAELRERLTSNNSCTEVSLSSSIEQKQIDSMASANEVNRLQDAMVTLEVNFQTEKSRLQRELVEMEEECLHLRNYNTELERNLKSMQEEFGDMRAELDAARMLANPVENFRGNSVFSELEDRRIRAEGLIIKQRQRIDELELASQEAQAKWKRELAETIQRFERREHERDTSLIDELTRERQRLRDENAKLLSQLKHLEDLQLDSDRSAVKVSKAFQLEEDSHNRLINTLESTVKNLEYQLKEKSSSESALHHRLLSSAVVRRRLQQQLWQQRDTNEQLSELVKSLKGGSDEDVVNSQPITKEPLIDTNGRTTEQLNQQSQAPSQTDAYQFSQLSALRDPLGKSDECNPS